MSRNRHEPQVRGYAVTHPPGEVTMPHEAGWDQLLYAGSGTLVARSASGTWTIPPHRALWLPAGDRVRVTTRSPTAVRMLYLDAGLRALAVTAPSALHVARFPRELVRHVVNVCPLYGDNSHALITVLVEQLRTLPHASLYLPVPSDPRAVSFIDADPTTSTELVARGSGAGVRTLERVFLRETGLTLGAWRRRARILGSLEALAAGSTVTAAAVAAGYSTPSAYVAAFRSELGTTPRRFLAP